MTTEYKDYIIDHDPSLTWHGKFGKLSYYHKDDTDGKFSTVESVEEAKQEIDELVDQDN